MARRTAGRVFIPHNPADLLALAKQIFEKHLADGLASPLNFQQDYNWALEGPKIVSCTINHVKAKEAIMRAEKHYGQRDVDLPAIRAIIQNSAQLLKSIYAKNPKILSGYGFTVDDSKQTKTPK